MEHVFILFLKIGTAAYENDDIPYDAVAANLPNLKEDMKKKRFQSHGMTPEDVEDVKKKMRRKEGRGERERNQEDSPLK